MHAGEDAIREACKQAGIKLKRLSSSKSYNDCLINKATDTHSTRTNPEKYTAPGQIVRFNLIEFTDSHIGKRYFLHFTNVATRYQWVRFCIKKNKAFQGLKDFVKFSNCILEEVFRLLYITEAQSLAWLPNYSETQSSNDTSKNNRLQPTS